MSIKGMLKNYYNGKPNQPDYTERDIPKTRPALFKAVFKVRWTNMVTLNLLYLVFWLPAIAWVFLNLIAMNNAYDSGESIQGYLTTCMLILFPLITITGPFNMAVSYILRNWARDEHSFVWLDFKAALKDNWKQGLLFGLINGLFPLVAYVCVTFYSQMAQSSILFYIPMDIILVCTLIWELCAQVIPTLVVSYNLKFRDIVRNALLMTIAKLPYAFLTLLGTLVMPIITVLFYFFLPGLLNFESSVVSFFYIVIGIAFNKLLTASFSNMVCEQFINVKIDGARVNIGLRSEKTISLHGDDNNNEVEV